MDALVRFGFSATTLGHPKTIRRLYGRTILERYGMTETLGIMANPYSGERRPGTVGRPLPGVTIRLSEGEQGEVFVKGPTVFAGYWRDDEATLEAFTSDGYFRTGDIAGRAVDGYYTLRGRRSDLIVSGGFNIYPREIEDLLTRIFNLMFDIPTFQRP